MPEKLSLVAEQVHVAKAVHGPADLAILITAVGGDECNVALTTEQAERLSILLAAHTRNGAGEAS